jgi:hypothetical protein
MTQPRDYPIVVHCREMVQAYTRRDFAAYQKERSIVLSCIENVDKMVKAALDAD